MNADLVRILPPVQVQVLTTHQRLVACRMSDEAAIDVTSRTRCSKTRQAAERPRCTTDVDLDSTKLARIILWVPQRT